MTWSRRNTNKMFKQKVCKENQNVAMKKVRIIYNDPDATDSSGDEQSDNQTNENGERIKRVVKEVYIPMENSIEESELSVGAGGTDKFKGVRIRESGNFAAEIRDPVENRKIWIGTFPTRGAAHEAYRLKEAEINKKMLANEKNSSCVSDKTTELSSGPSVDVVDNVQGSTKDTIRPTPKDKLVVNEELSDVEIDVEIVEDPKSSPLPDHDHYSASDFRNDLSEPTVEKLDDYPSASLMNFDDSMINHEEKLLVDEELVEDLSPLRSPLPGFEWGKEELDWYNSL